MMRRGVLITIAGAMFLSLSWITVFSQDEGNKMLAGTLGTYANPPRFTDKRVDMDRLIAELQDLQVNTYHWLVRETYDDLTVVKKFLKKAGKAGINVWLTMVPPSESPPVTKVGYSEPYRLDFEKWAVKLAKLSRSEPNLVAWSIDDFVHNLNYFTPEYVGRFTRMAKQINPDFKFVPCCYFKKTTPGFAAKYGPFLDGILFPYRAESAGANLQDPSKVGNEIEQLRKMFAPGFPIIIDIYATRHSRLGPSTAGYVREVMKEGFKFADGVFIYRHQDPVNDAEKYQVIKKEFNAFVNKK
ncbi:MAG: hypothetical protein RBS73_00380 [Prolixibacteraceae bacterium]|jgi:hypothetical protein|nr:hypothetical protein [Prolixibacteraceae bacterium]